MKQDLRAKMALYVNRTIDTIGGVLFAVMLFFSGYNVFSWWILGKRYGQLEEIVLACFVWVAYISLGQHYKRQEYIRVDFIVSGLPPRVKKAVDFLADLASFIIGCLIAWFAIQLTLKSGNKLTAVVKIPYALIDMGVVVGMISLLIAIILKYIPEKPGTGAEEEVLGE